jgi:hypothetical protein
MMKWVFLIAGWYFTIANNICEGLICFSASVILLSIDIAVDKIKEV